MSRINLRNLSSVETLNKTEMNTATGGHVLLRRLCIRLPFIGKRCITVPVPHKHLRFPF